MLEVNNLDCCKLYIFENMMKILAYSVRKYHINFLILHGLSWNDPLICKLLVSLNTSSFEFSIGAMKHQIIGVIWCNIQEKTILYGSA